MASLKARLDKLEQRPGASRARWRAHLAHYFQGPQYDGHRAAIVEALCSDQPQYTFVADCEGQRSTYVVWWWQRGDGGELPPPIVHVLVGVALEDL